MLQKAMEIDSELSELYSSLAFMTSGYEWDLVKADQYLLRSIELNPNNTFAHGWRGEMLATMNRFDEALAAVEAAIQSDPLFGLIYSLLGIVLCSFRSSGSRPGADQKIDHNGSGQSYALSFFRHDVSDETC